jgi:hypothetical protein
MTYVHEAGLVRDLVAQVGQRHPITLRLYDRRKGDEPGFADSFQAEGVSVEWVRSCTYNRYLESFDDVSLGLAPLCPESPFSRGKSFGKVLAYLDARVPVIGSDACEHGNFFDSKTGVISNEPNHWCQAAVSLLQDATARQSMADRAFERFKTELSVASSARRLDDIMRGYLKRR